MTNGPLSAYRAKLAAGDLKPDTAQALAAEKLQSLHNALAHYRPSQGESGWLARFGISLGRRREEPPPPPGLYIFGEVGRGKSMLMDLFFATAEIPGKRRVHFHEFMRDVHAELHAWRQANKGSNGDPIPRLARSIAEEAWLLCFDELQVHDIADAMILGRLFQCLFDNGVVMVATSNRAPDDLYKDGLQRDRFLPFISLIKSKMDILELDSERDYRLGRKRGLRVYHTPLDTAAQAALDEAFLRLSGGRTGQRESIAVQGRSLEVPVAADGVARFTFEELCARPLGAADYLALATHYHTILISNIPELGPANRDQAKRFVNLIDALYEHKVTLICSAAAPPEKLYPRGDGAFEFQRTVSRLMEMQSEDYVGSEHLT
ncbi:cell division protein ZapE [Telmatospirillum sp. J64-1]|uniref:cell division protein ZapE n=1 Tax=Telmatospirillum sp. J64-1 TaxID=2502183 RepID=UPI00115D986B|nr:cell division protein ZapE [Telmatospirillum sp. J64-1]